MQINEQRPYYLITPKQTIYEDDYEGDGEFGGNHFYYVMENRVVKVVLAKHYKGQTYENLKESPYCDSQGYFYGGINNISNSGNNDNLQCEIEELSLFLPKKIQTHKRS